MTCCTFVFILRSRYSFVHQQDFSICVLSIKQFYRQLHVQLTQDKYLQATFFKDGHRTEFIKNTNFTSEIETITIHAHT